jgi:hypothetical protein
MVRLARPTLPGIGVALALAAAATAACIDTVHDNQVAALGPDLEPPGPEHRAWQPCLVCHGGSGPAQRTFSTAGTVLDTQGQTAPAIGALVLIEDVDGRTYTATTNDVGNFFVTPDQLTPHYPTQMSVSSADGSVVQSMLTHSSREGSCAVCHQPTVGPSSAGPVYLNAKPVVP